MKFQGLGSWYFEIAIGHPPFILIREVWLQILQPDIVWERVRQDE